MQEGLISRGIGASGSPIDIYNNQRAPYGRSTHSVSIKNTKTIYSVGIDKTSYVENVNGITKLYKTNMENTHTYNDKSSSISNLL